MNWVSLFSTFFLGFMFLISPLKTRGEEKCNFQHLAQISLKNEGGYLLIPVMINGQKVNMIVDTGSEGSLISKESADFLRLPIDPIQQTLVHGPRGTQRLVNNVLVQHLKLGKLSIGPVTIPLGDLPGYPKAIPPVVGLIGGDILSQFDVDFNVKKRLLNLWNVKNSSLVCKSPPFWRRSEQVVDIQKIGHRAIIKVEVNHHPVEGLLDSGARSRILSLETALRVGIDPAQLQSSPGGISSGVDMEETIYHWHRFNSFQIGNEIENFPILTVAPLHDTVDMLIGSDWFSNHQVWIAYQRNKLFFKKNNE